MIGKEKKETEIYIRVVLCWWRILRRLRCEWVRMYCVNEFCAYVLCPAEVVDIGASNHQ